MELIEQRTYNSNLLKGTGLIQETLTLVEYYEEGESILDYHKRILEGGLLSKSTENRVKDIVRNVFAGRYLVYDLPIPKYLRNMRDNYASMDVITQLFYIYTCRANAILADFIREVYFPKSWKSYSSLKASDPKDFIRESLMDGRIPVSWSDSTVSKVSEHIIATLIDFRLIERNKNILPYRLIELSANYLIHELHFRGLTDYDIWHHEDWKLFGLTKEEVIKEIEKISFSGTFIFQFSGELLRISWQYKNMEDFIKNECS